MSNSSAESKRVIGRVYMVRHGETEENREGVIQGQLDTKLNETGERQAAVVGERFRDVKIDWAVSSDLQRAVKTAEAILVFHGNIELEKDRRLRERGLGELEGQKMGIHRVGGQKGVEPANEFRRRGVEWWEERVVGRMRAGETALIVSHGGWITALLRELNQGEINFKGKCTNASLSVVHLLQDRSALVVSFADQLVHSSLQSSPDQI